MVDVLLLFSQVHTEFRIPEFQSLRQLFGIELEGNLDAKKFLQMVRFKCMVDVTKILSRAMLIKSAYEVYVEGSTHDEVAGLVQERIQLLEKFNVPSASWALRFSSHGRKYDNVQRNCILEKYASFILLGRAPIDLKNPQNAFFIVEDNANGRVYFCRHIGDGSGRLKVDYDIKKRKYIGNSTMDPELAFLQANLSLCRPDTLALDPFCGTGGLMLPSAHFGSLSVGLEIDYQVARAKGKSSRTGEQLLRPDQSIRVNFEQYGIERRFGGVLLADSSRAALWRAGGLFDAIVTDPPYGIREKGQKLGETNAAGGENSCSERNSDRRYPEKSTYAISGVYLGLLDLAVKLLRVGGRLSFWFPVLRREYSEDVLPQHICLRRLHNCEQILTKEASRRLLVYEKMSENVDSQSSFFPVDCYEAESYRSKIFNNSTPSI